MPTVMVGPEKGLLHRHPCWPLYCCLRNLVRREVLDAHRQMRIPRPPTEGEIDDHIRVHLKLIFRQVAMIALYDREKREPRLVDQARELEEA